MKRQAIVIKKNKYFKRMISALITAVICACLPLTMLTGCSEQVQETGIPIYYISNTETKLEIHPVDIELTGDRAQDVTTLLEILKENPESLMYKAPLSYPFEIKSYKVDDTRITIDFNEEYKNLGVTTEVLVRAAIVQTLLQVKGIKYIFFNVEGESLQDNMGRPVGRMSAKTFIYNDGNAINTYDEVVIRLFFANEEGNALIGAYRDKFYSTNVPLELFVVEETIAGPSGQIAGLYPTINPETNVISVSTSDGVCYVNLDSGFTTTVGNVPTEMAAYSLVNALTELPSVDKVQILVNGEVPAIFQSSTFERNEDIVTTLTDDEEQIVETDGEP